MSFFNSGNGFNNPILSSMRDVLLAKDETHKIVLNKIVLSELPDQFSGIQVKYANNESIVYSVITSGNPTSSQVLVDWTNGILTFNDSEDGKNMRCIFSGKGIQYIPVSRVYTQSESGQVTETLDEAMQDNINEITNTKTAAEASIDAKVTQGKVDIDTKVASVTSQVNTVLTNANTALSTAQSANTTAQSTITSAGTAATNASTQATAAQNAATAANNAANTTKFQYKTPVATFAAIATTYPSPVLGDTVQVTADNKWWRYNGTVWENIQTLNLTGYATTSDLDAADVIRADLFRQQAHSGVLDYSSPVTATSLSSLTTKGSVFTIDKASSLLSTYLNLIGLTNSNVLINGYKLSVTSPTNVGIQLNPPPTYGYREDLVFLEAWFPQTGTKGQMSLRIRVVDGVDFSLNPEGFTKLNGNGANADFLGVVLPQGGNASPVTFTNNFITRFCDYFQRKAFSGFGLISPDDVGLYIAGDGSTTSKSTLLTLDGYVYAIPLFRIKRRNSGGYRKDNPNGARDYYSLTSTISWTQGTNSISVTLGSSSSDIKVGDTVDIYNSGGSVIASKVTVVSVSGTSVTCQTAAPLSTTIINSTNNTLRLISDRPDGLYSNIIDATDIIDLRHKVSLTGYNPQQILDENFDKLIRGENTTKDNKVTIKDVYGLKRAPLGLTQDLQSVTVKRADGTLFEAKNLLGIKGNIDNDISYFANIYGTPTATIDSTTGSIGTKSLKVVSSSNGHGGYIKIDTIKANRYYIFAFDSKVTSGALRVGVYDQTNASYIVSESPITSSSSSFICGYRKFIAPANTSTDIRFQFKQDGTTATTFYIDGIRIYEIDQATYNLIDVDTNYTGGDKIGVLFPYVDSLPNFVENLNPDFPQWTSISSNAVINNPNTLTLTATAAWQQSYVEIPVVGSQTYVVSGVFTVTNPFDVYYVGYDSSGNVVTSSTDIIRQNVSGNYAGTFTTASNVVKIRLFFSNTTSTSGTYSVTNFQIEKLPSANPYVPYGRWLIPADYQGFNAHLGNNTINHYDGTNGGRFTAQRSIYSDAQTSETRFDVVEALRTPQSHIKVTQATEGQWAANDKIVISSIGGVVTGVIDADTTIARITQASATLNGTTGHVFNVDDVSKISVNDTFIIFVPSTGANRVNNGQVQTWTVTAVDTTNKTITVNSSGTLTSSAVQADDLLIETTSTSSLPSIAYTAQQSKTAQSGSTSTTIKLASDASTVDSYYNNLNVTIVSGTGAGQTRTISGYVGSTKVATVSVAWTITPDTTSVYSITVQGTWTNLGTISATFTLGTMPTATDATLGDANKTNISIGYSVNYPAGKGFSYVPTDVLEGTVNDQKVVKTQTVSVKANFSGKIAGSTDLVPHIAKRVGDQSTLNSPNGSWAEFTATGSTGYDRIYTLDGTVHSQLNNNNGGIAQVLFSFDLIRAVEDKYGEIPVDGTANKVAWLKVNVSSVVCDWYGYGSSVGGNKASLATWVNNGSTWTVATNHTSSSVTKLTQNRNSSDIVNMLDANGFIYFLAYADASDGVTASTINTDYVELSITIKTDIKSAFDGNTLVGTYTKLQPENPFPVLNENLLTSNQAFPVDWSSNLGGLAGSGTTTVTVDSIGVLKVVTDGAFTNQGLFIGATSVSSGLNIPANTYVTFKSRVKFPSGSTFNLAYYNGSAIGATTASYTGTGDWQDVSLTTKDASGIASFYVRTSNAVATTFYVGQSKLQTGVVATSWSEGRKKLILANGLSKVSGSTIENPHRALFKALDTFGAPNTFSTEFTQSNYDSLSKQDGVLTSQPTVPTTGQYDQRVIEVDLSNLGMSLSELRKALNSFTFTTLAFSQGDNSSVLTYGTTVKVWDNTTSAWVAATTGTASTVETLTWANSTNATLQKYVNSSQKVYFLIHSTYPTGTSGNAIVNLDYWKLSVSLKDYVDYVKSNIVYVQPETKEIRTFFPNHSFKLLGGGASAERVELSYRYIPVPKDTLGNATMLTQPAHYTITTNGTGNFSNISTNAKYRNAAYRVLGNDSNVYNLLSENLYGIVDANIETGVKRYVADTFYATTTKIGDTISNTVAPLVSSLPSGVGNANYLVLTPVLVSINNQLYLRVFYKYKKDLTTFVLPNTSVDFLVIGRPLMK